MKKVLMALGILAVVFVVYSTQGVRYAQASALTVVGFSQVGSESDWRMANTQSMRVAFSEANGFRLIIKDAQQQQRRQVAAIRDFIAQKVDFIVVAPVTEDGWDDALKEAEAAGIPVIIVDRRISVSNDDLYSNWVGSDFRKEGDFAVEWMEKKLETDKELLIVHLQGSLGSSAQIGRTEALDAGMARNANWRIVARDSGGFSQVKGKEVMERILRQHPRIDVLYAENDDMAFGAMEAMDEAKRTYGLNGDTTIISFDATRAGLTATLQGRINFNVECNPLHGPRVKEIIQSLKRGEHSEKYIYVDEVAFDARTITQAELDAREY